MSAGREGAELAVPAEFGSQGDTHGRAIPCRQCQPGAEPTPTGDHGAPPREKFHGCSQKSLCGTLLHPSSFGDTCGDRAGDRDSTLGHLRLHMGPSAHGAHPWSREREKWTGPVSWNPVPQP